MLVPELFACQRQLSDVLQAVRRRFLNRLVIGADKTKQVAHHSVLMHGHAVPWVFAQLEQGQGRRLVNSDVFGRQIPHQGGHRAVLAEGRAVTSPLTAVA